MEIDLEKVIHFDPEKIKKMYDGDYKKVAKDLAIENTKLHIINSSKEQENKRLNNIIEEVREYIDKLLKEEFKITDPFNTDYGKKCQRDYFNSKELETILDILKEKE